jgi:hypothetical protein
VLANNGTKVSGPGPKRNSCRNPRYILWWQNFEA